MKPRSGMVLALLAATIASPPALAAEAARQGPAIDASKRPETQKQMKERVLQHIDARIRILQAAKSCVQAASSMTAVAVCHAQERKQTKELRDKDRREIQVDRTERREPSPFVAPANPSPR